MKILFRPFLALFLLTACTQENNIEKALQSQIDSLQIQLDNAYKPGFGDFMGSIQNHHNKLWFAGFNENWELAAFEIHELEELFEDIKTLYPDRDETQTIPMIEPGLVAVNNAIKKQNIEEFKQGYITLTNSCNTCHQANKHDFIKIIVPTSPSYSNQDYKRNMNE
jgi:hypothetical protein